jgi:hypothetical protein
MLLPKRHFKHLREMLSKDFEEYNVVDSPTIKNGIVIIVKDSRFNTDEDVARLQLYKYLDSNCRFILDRYHTRLLAHNSVLLEV